MFIKIIIASVVITVLKIIKLRFLSGGSALEKSVYDNDNEEKGTTVIDPQKLIGSLVVNLLLFSQVVYMAYVLRVTIVSLNPGESKLYLTLLAGFLSLLIYGSVSILFFSLEASYNSYDTNSPENGPSNKSTKIQLEKNYSPSYAMGVYRLIELSSTSIKRKKKDKRFYSVNYQTIDSYPAQSFFDVIVDHININIAASLKGFTASVLEAEMNTKDNFATIVLIINILEDKRLLDFILSTEGTMQRESIENKLVEINRDIKAEVVEAEKLQEKTRVNELNAEIERLKRNNFSKIEDIK